MEERGTEGEGEGKEREQREGGGRDKEGGWSPHFSDQSYAFE